MKFSLLAATAMVGAAMTLAACDSADDADLGDADASMAAETDAGDSAMADDADDANMAAAEAETETAAPAGPPGGFPQGPSEIAVDAVGTGETIDVTLPDILGPDGEIQRMYTSYGENVSPAISWTPVDGAESYSVILQDPITMPNGSSFIVLHWLTYNIPGGVTSLPEGVAPGADIPGGGMQGNNLMQNMGYTGPRPPAGQPAHQYTFQVIALDTMLDVPQDVTYDQLLDAMDGHVVGAGSEVTPYTAPADAPAGPPGGGGGGN